MADNKSNKKKQKLYKILRYVILISILITITAFGLMHQHLDKLKPPGVDAFCPFGGLESLITLITSGVMLRRIAVSSFVLLIATIILALILRRSFCGNICPLGTLQELSGNIGKKIFKKHFVIPNKVDRIARYLKYIVLVLVITFSVIVGELVIRPYDPWPAYMHLSSNELFAEFLVGFIVLIIALLGSFFYNRFFCKYLCPMGAFLGLINKIGWFRVTRNPDTCINCKACTKKCPVNINVHEQKEIKSAECINCNLCINACPVKDTLYLSGPKKTRISSITALIITILIFGAVITTATVMDKFDWVQKTLAEEIHEQGSFDPELIKGRMTFKEVSIASGIPEQEFLKKFPISNEEFNRPIKEVHGNYDFETEDVREFVREFMETQQK
jgi:polyferredoxin